MLKKQIDIRKIVEQCYPCCGKSNRITLFLPTEYLFYILKFEEEFRLTNLFNLLIKKKKKKFFFLLIFFSFYKFFFY